MLASSLCFNFKALSTLLMSLMIKLQYWLHCRHMHMWEEGADTQNGLKSWCFLFVSPQRWDSPTLWMCEWSGYFAGIVHYATALSGTHAWPVNHLAMGWGSRMYSTHVCMLQTTLIQWCASVLIYMLSPLILLLPTHTMFGHGYTWAWMGGRMSGDMTW